MNPRTAYEELTAKIIEQLESGVAPWVRPWSTLGQSDRPVNYSTKKPYHGSNVLQLWMAQAAFGYPSCEWMTYLQAREMGGVVRRGEHGTPIIFAQPLVKEKEVAGELQFDYAGFILRGFSVFNIAQIEGLLDRHEVPGAVFAPIASAEMFISRIGARLSHGGERAFYSPGTDSITLPGPEAFKEEASYYATSLHEHTHWTGAEHRLRRTFGKRYGDDAYAFEVLVAEMGSAFILADLGIPGQLQHAEYIGNWAKVLRADTNALWTACSAASKSCGYLHHLGDIADAKAA